MPVRAVAFDLFHTLVDPEDFRPKEFVRPREIARLLGLPPAEFEQYWAAELPVRMVQRAPSVTDRVRQYCATQGLSPPPGIWSDVSDILGRYTDLALRNPRRNVEEALRRLKARGLRLGVVSNCDEREVRAWPESPIAKWFDAAVFSCDIGVAKPAVEAYSALSPRWGHIPLSEAIFVGDGSHDELAGARRAGFAQVVFDAQFVAVNGIRSSEENERVQNDADLTITALDELLPALPS